MDLKTIVIVVLSISIAAWFTPTPEELRDQFRSGQDFYAARDYRRAIEQYDRIIGSQSTLVREDSVRVTLLNNELNVGVRTAAYYQKGNAFRNLGQADSAIAYYRVVERREDSPFLSALAQYQIYEIFYTDKRYAEAIAEARVLVMNHPGSDKVPQALYDIGWAFRDLGHRDSAALAFERLIELYPDHPLDPRARYQVAEIYFELKDWHHAIAEFDGLITKYRPEKFAKSEWENVELKALKERKLFEAMTEKDVDLSTLELTAKAQVRLGDIYRERTMYDSAMFHYRRVISSFGLLPSLVEATYIKMAEYTADAFDVETGIAVYRSAIDENFSNRALQAKLQYKIARTYQDRKLYIRAGEAYLFYAGAYAAEADGIKFPVEQSMFLATSNFYNAKDHHRTVVLADSMLTRFPSTTLAPKLYLYKGLSSAALFRFDDARLAYRNAIVSDPASNEAILARTQLGKTYLDERQYEQAIAEFRTLLEGNRARIDTSEIAYFLGLSLYGAARYDEAVVQLSAVDPASTYYPYTFARITRGWVAQKQPDSARAFLLRAEEQARRDTSGHLPFIRLARAELYTGLQEPQRAVAEFDAVIGDASLTENTRMQALYGRGLLYAEMGEHRKAVDDLSACLNSAVFVQVFTSLVPAAKEKLAFALIQTGRESEGETLITELVASAASDPERARYLGGLTEFYFRKGDYRRAVTTGTRVLQIPDADEPTLVRAYVTMGNALGNMQEHDAAIDRVTEAARRFPSNAFVQETLFQLSNIYFNGGDYANTAKVLQRYRDIYPDGTFREDAHFTHAMSLYSMGKADDAVAEFRSFLRAFPESPRAPEAQLQIAETYFNTNRFGEAAAEYRRVYRSWPSNANAALAMFNEGWTYYQDGQPQRMMETFREMRTRFPGNRLAGDAAFSIGDYYYNNRTYDSALIAYQSFIDGFPDHGRVDEARTLIHDLNQVEAYQAYEKAMAFFDAKNWNLAIRELTAVMERYPGTDIVYGCKANIASAYAQLGDRKEALALLDQILDEWKDVDAARSAVFFAQLHKRWIESGK